MRRFIGRCETISIKTKERIKLLRIRKLPRWLIGIIASAYHLLYKREFCIILPKNELWLVIKRNLKIMTPLPYMPSLRDVSDTYERYFKLEHGDVVVDVGATVGEFAIHAATQVGEGGVVIAIEPEPRNFACLRYNVSSFNNVRLVNKAVTEIKMGKIRLYLDPLYMGGHSTKIPKYSFIEVPTDTLDNIMASHGIRKVDFLKINCEGGNFKGG